MQRDLVQICLTFVQILLIHLYEELFSIGVVQQRFLPILENACGRIDAASIPHHHSFSNMFIYIDSQTHKTLPICLSTYLVVSCPSRKTVMEERKDVLQKRVRYYNYQRQENVMSHRTCAFLILLKIRTSPWIVWVNTQKVEGNMNYSIVSLPTKQGSLASRKIFVS